MHGIVILILTDGIRLGDTPWDMLDGTPTGILHGCTIGIIHGTTQDIVATTVVITDMAAMVAITEADTIMVSAMDIIQDLAEADRAEARLVIDLQTAADQALDAQAEDQ